MDLSLSAVNVSRVTDAELEQRLADVQARIQEAQKDPRSLSMLMQVLALKDERSAIQQEQSRRQQERSAIQEEQSRRQQEQSRRQQEQWRRQQEQLAQEAEARRQAQATAAQANARVVELQTQGQLGVWLNWLCHHLIAVFVARRSLCAPVFAAIGLWGWSPLFVTAAAGESTPLLILPPLTAPLCFEIDAH